MSLPQKQRTEAIWEAMKAAPDGFTIYDLSLEQNDRRRAQIYLSDLVKAGYAAQNERGYELTRRPRRAPRFHSDGSEARLSKQQRLWNAMRAMKVFALRDLAMTASLPEDVIGYNTARYYSKQLLRSGYVQTVSHKRGSAPRAYRLHPCKNTGPDAPLIRADGTVFDPNV